MHYSHYQYKEKKIPGFVVLGIVVVFVIGLVALFSRQDAPVVTQHDPTNIERVDVVNIRDASVTVFWRTKELTKGYVRHLNRDFYDERDSQTDLKPRHNHVVTITTMQSDAEIPYFLVIDGKTVGQSTELPFTARTGRHITNSLEIAPLYGDVGRQNGTIESDAVVLVTIGQAKPLLTLTNADGTFLFSPCCLYSSQTGEPIRPSPDDPVRIEIIAEDGTSKMLLTELSRMSPLPDKILVDSAEDEAIVAETSESEQLDESRAPEVLAVSDSTIRFEPVDIIFPRVDAAIPGTRPLIRGVGEPGEAVKGGFDPADRLFQVTVDEHRNWVYQPSFDFQAGPHTLTVQTRNELGQPVSLSRTFTILKSGEAVLGDATGSATLTPTEAPTPSPDTSLTLAPTFVPTISTTPPVTGFNIVPFTVLSLVLIVIGAGFILLF